MSFFQAGVTDAEGIDRVWSAGLGRRYAFMGPLETAFLNADGKNERITRSFDFRSSL